MNERISDRERTRSGGLFGWAAHRVAALGSAAVFLLFSPLLAGGVPSGEASLSAEPLIAQGKTIFKTHTCIACHGKAAGGTVAAPALAGMTNKRSPEELTHLLRHRTRAMIYGGMPPVSVSQKEMAALVAYLRSL